MIALATHGLYPNGIKPLILEVDTTKAGSASNTFVLPCGTGTLYVYNATIHWGDGNTSIITTYNDADLTHIYSTPGIYTIKIFGELAYIVFGNLGDKLKITKIKQWGDVLINNWNFSYYGCSNLDVTATDLPKFKPANFGSTGYAFQNCTSLTNDFTGLDFTGLGAKTSSQMFYGCTLCNPQIDTWINFKFENSQYIVTGAAFNRDLSNSDFTSVINLFQAFNTSSFSTANYDKLLLRLDAQGVSGINIGANVTNYTIVTSGTARANLVTRGCTITDAGGI